MNEDGNISTNKQPAAVWISTIIGPLVVAAVLGLVGDRYRLGLIVDDMAGQLLSQQIYIDQLIAFKTEGGRFTIEQGQGLKAEMQVLVGKCEKAATQIHDMEVKIATLPPDKWQERIMLMEKDLQSLYGFMRIQQAPPGDTGWFMNIPNTSQD